MAHPQDTKRPRSTSLTAPDDVSRRRQPQSSAESRELGIVVKREIPLDLVQNTAEYLGRVPSLLSFRGVSTGWQGAVSDAVGFLNGRCWTRRDNERPLVLKEDYPLLLLGLDDDDDVVARCALLCLAHRLESLEFLYHTTDQLDFAMRLLGENNTVLTALSLIRPSKCSPTVNVSCLQNCRALKKLNLANTSMTDAGIRGLERIPTLEELSLAECKQLTDVSCLQHCRALKKLSLWGCKQVKDVSSLQHCRALKKLNLHPRTDVGLRTGTRFALNPAGFLLFAGSDYTRMPGGIAVKYIRFDYGMRSPAEVRQTNRVDSIFNQFARDLKVQGQQLLKSFSLASLYARPHPAWYEPAFLATFADAYLDGTGLGSEAYLPWPGLRKEQGPDGDHDGPARPEDLFSGARPLLADGGLSLPTRLRHRNFRRRHRGCLSALQERSPHRPPGRVRDGSLCKQVLRVSRAHQRGGQRGRDVRAGGVCDGAVLDGRVRRSGDCSATGRDRTSRRPSLCRSLCAGS
jgi:hypothetical protein